MGLLDRLLGRETRAETARASDPYLAEFFGMHGPVGAIGPDVVLSSLAVAARCVSLRSELMASVPLHVFGRTADGGRERADDLPLYGVLHDQANPNATAFEVREALVRSLDTFGNAFARIERNGRGQPTALYHLPNANVTVERLPSGRLRYRVSEPAGGTAVLLQEEVLHVRGPSRDGVMGLSPMQIARGALGFAVSQRDAAEAQVNNVIRPSGVFSYPMNLNPEQKKMARESIAQQQQGARNRGQFFVLDGGVKWESMSVSSEDAELVASLKLSNEDVARIFGLPPTSVGITDKATYSNTEQEARALVQNAIGPLAGRVEAAMMRCLLTDVGRRTLYIEHDLAGLLRGDVSARYTAYATGRQWGWLSPNDVRRLENMSPIDDGDEYVRPLNMGPIGAPAPIEPGVA
ncbi:phage portal protein [Methylopila sp. 73B]|uniref:phage portal protein n=1 Tax=Methylopila sp. 73B TaxID=1120792 RepID=UPI0003733D65|nr:phage portal protein [Methylopila sp. 73B]